MSDEWWLSTQPCPCSVPGGMAAEGQNRKRAIQKVSVCSAPKRTSTPPRPAFRNRPTADLAQTDCAGHGAHGAEHHSFTGV